MKNYDFIAIGDTVTDAFIRLKDAAVNCDINQEEVYIINAVGNAANAAVSATRLGLSSALVTNLGDDQNGGECLSTLEKNGVGLDFVKTNRNKETNYHYVLWYEDDRTILVKHQEYDYVVPDFGNPKWVYFSSVAPTATKYHADVIDHLKKNPDTKLAFQPGVFEIKMGIEHLKEMYKRCEVFFCNVEEARRILGIKEDIEAPDLVGKIANLGPKIVVITDGSKGAYAFDGTDTWFMPPYPDPKPPYERTGAGDAFASTFTAASLDVGAHQFYVRCPICWRTKGALVTRRT